MIDKQKQIDEMARVLTLCSRSSCVGCGCECIDYRRATAIYNAGYRKIPENAVVFIKEEWDKLNDMLDEKYDVCVKHTRKETAEKFADKLRCEYIDFDDIDEVWVGGLREDISKICKEITEGKVNE